MAQNYLKRIMQAALHPMNALKELAGVTPSTLKDNGFDKIGVLVSILAAVYKCVIVQYLGVQKHTL